MQTPDVVVLVPGFLGFLPFGGSHYFAERAVAVVRPVGSAIGPTALAEMP